MSSKRWMRGVAVFVIGAGGLLLTKPRTASAAPRFDCDLAGYTESVLESPCAEHVYDQPEGPSGPTVEYDFVLGCHYDCEGGADPWVCHYSYEIHPSCSAVIQG